MHVHIGAVKQRVALGQQGDVAAGLEMCGDPIGGLGVEVRHRTVVAAGVVGIPGGHRVDEVFFDLAGPQIRLGDTAGDALAMARTVIRDHVDRADDPRSFDGHQFRVARTQADAVQGAACHSRVLAIALTAAAAIALPPRRPRTTR